MKAKLACLLPLLATASFAHAQEPATRASTVQETGFSDAAATVRRQLDESVAELEALRAQIADEQIPLNRKLSELEAELIAVRAEFQQTSRLLDSRTLDLSNLRGEILKREDESRYLSDLLGEYVRGFESRVHIAELQRYEREIEIAKLAPENSNLGEHEIYQAQASLLTLSLDRLSEALGGTRFEGTAVDPEGLVSKGTFALIGPYALFLSEDGKIAGTAEQRLGSLEPSVIPFADPLDAEAATAAVSTGEGAFPFDPTLGNAHKIEATEETLREHVEKGGPVMIPIFAMAGLALLVALFKWFGLAFKRKPSRKKIAALLGAVAENDPEAARAAVARIKGPVGKMLSAGVEHLNEPRELIEEVMYEQMLTAKLKLQRMLPFIAVCAASAPLLGLLGTVTGIINTFKLITVFGSGDVKTLSGGISEALITTEFGLIVAIPSLLLHAFLSRKARAIVGHMETSAASFLNEVGRAQGGQHALRTHGAPAGGGAAPDPDMVRQQVSAILGDLLGPLMEEQRSGNADASAGTSSGNARARVPASQPG